MKKRPVTILFSFLLSIFLFTAGVEAREIPLPGEEAPTALFEAELEDTEVDFFIQGNWTANLSGGFGLTWGDTVQGVQPAVLPDFTDGFLFDQTPELTLSLWYKNRYFFETMITKEQTLETFLFGYYGEDGDFLQEARIGNTDIGYGDTGTLSIPAASRDSFGAYTLMQTESTAHQVALRYDPAQADEVHYRGSSLVEEERLGVRSFMQGRFFILPDDNVEGLEVYLQDDSGVYTDGSGRRYRRFGDADMSISSADGLVFLKKPAGGDLVVHYTKGGLAVGNASLGGGALCGVDGDVLDLDAGAVDFVFNGTVYLGITLSTLARTIGGKTALLLYSPGEWSPFELQGTYPSAGLGSIDTDRISARLTDRNSSDGTVLPIVGFQDADILRISPEGSSIRDHAARYPLLNYTSDFPSAAEVYGPDSAGSTTAFDKELLLEKLSPVSSYNIGTNALEGSLEVLRNGVPTGNYTFNPETGEINFFIPPSGNERIDITYRTQTAKAVGGDIYAVIANDFTFGERWSADLDVGLRWNADPNAYITEEGEAEGSILGSGRITYSSERFTASIEGGINVSSPNTTGRLRLFGMDNTAYSVSLGPENFYPGAPVSSGQYGGTGGLDLPHSDRGALYYRDYYDYSFTQGYSLRHYSWTPPADQIYSYDEIGGDNRIGPYLVSTDDETEGNAMVLEYELETGQWVGGTLPIAWGDGAVDLSHARAITLLMKSLGRTGAVPAGDIDIHLLLGRLSEDLDDDGNLDEESSPYDQGFTFNIPGGATASVTPALTWAPQDSRVNTEDLDGNGVLDGNAAPLAEPFIAASEETAGVTSPSLEPGGWYRITIPLDAEAREKLQAVTAMEIVLEENDGAPAAGRILVADIELEGSPFTGSAAGGTAVDVYTRALDPGSGDYDKLYSHSDAELLNGDSTYNTRVLMIDWDDPVPGPSDTVTVTGFLNPADLGNYESLSFFMKTGPNPPDLLTLTVSNPAGEGMAVEFTPPASTGWSKYTWDLDADSDDERITRNGNSLGGADVSSSSAVLTRRKRSAEGVNRMTITADISSEGSIQIDEFYLHDPILGVGAGGVTELEYHHPGPIVTIKEVPVVQDLDFLQTVYARQDAYGGGLTPAPSSNLAFTNQMAFSLLEARLSFDYDGSWDGIDYFPSGGYQAMLPFFRRRLVLNDSYHETTGYGGREIARKSSLKLQETDLFTGTLSGLIDWDGMELYRRWESQIGMNQNGADQEKSLFSAVSKEIFASETDQVEVDQGDFWQRYGKAATLLYPDYTEGALYRSAEHSIAFRAGGEHFTCTLTPTLSSRSHADELPFSLTAGNSLSMDLTLQPAAWQDKGGRLTFSYKRSGSTRRTYSEESDFGQDFQEILDRIPDFPLVWTNVPLAELWSEGSRDDFSSCSEASIRADYAATGGFAFTRQPGSQIEYLVLPVSLSASLQRNLQRDLDSLTDNLIIDGEYRTTALNLFGSLGRYPLFQWYRTGEISHSCSYTGGIPLAAGAAETHGLDAGQFLQLKLNERNTIGMRNQWSGTFHPEENGRESSYGGNLFWERKKPVHWQLPLQDELKADRQFLVHREEIELDMEWEDTLFVSVTCSGGHKTELQLPETGFARVFSRFGYKHAVTPADAGRLHQNTLSFEVGVETELRF